MKTWILANPVLSTLLGIGIIAGIVALIVNLTKGDDEASDVPNANPAPERAGSLLLFPRFSATVRPSSMGGGAGGVAGGVSGGRMGSAKS